MTPTIEDHQELITRLIQSFTDHHRELTVTAKDLPGRVDWTVETHIDDQAKVIGRQGSHYKALAHLVRALGDRVDLDYHFKVVSPVVPARRNPSDPRQATEYDPTDAWKLLCEWVDSICSESPVVTYTNGQKQLPIEYVFPVHPTNRADEETLFHQPDNNGLTNLGALAVLFRAYGNSEGVSFKVTEG